MKFGFALYSNFSTEQSSEITKYSDFLEQYISDRNYGNEVKEMYVGIICVKPEFEQFFKKRAVKYKQGIKSEITDGQLITTQDCLTFDLKFDYSKIGNLKGQELIGEIHVALIGAINELK